MPDYKRHGARYRARRRAVDILFEAETRDIDPVSILEDREQLSADPQNAVAPIAAYTRDIVCGAAEKLDDLDDALEQFLNRDWELHRLPAVDRQILRVATWEILFNEEVPAAIAIANALEMATEYSGNQAPPYIHAVLDGIVQAQSPDAPGVEPEPTLGDGSEDAPSASESPEPEFAVESENAEDAHA
ncbi:transcription antitermination factor NusB [Corynebacterium sp. TA-R-1]|uniref:Transcription antitermination protein NusB n=1 Tax=Corynebacterium stercoris TaxID=2943490 RepID=A0ABT1FZH0_9CORY|nr:transcription antitermination factor NusB [Corynebacterium stercoris]MCP1387156.1 transcription antitermination factor NusB [Corynebacterium stercoris]